MCRAVESKFRMGKYYPEHNNNNNNNNTEYASLPYMGFSSICDTQLSGKFLYLTLLK